MTDFKRERVAKNLLELFRDIWCNRESDEEPHFNCSKCEFEMDDGRCGVKVFLYNTRYEGGVPQGVIADTGSEEE